MLEVHIALIALATCLSVSHCKLDYTKNQKISNENFKVPNVPESLMDSAYGSSRFAIVWSNRVHERNLTQPYLSDYDPDRPGLISNCSCSKDIPDTNDGNKPSIIVIPTELHMIDLMPLDAPTPLYSKRFSVLTDVFLLDSMSTKSVHPSDSRLLTPEGLAVKTMNGKDLRFKKDPNTGLLTINDLTVEKVAQLDGEEALTIFEIDGLLFGYRLRIGKAFQILQLTPSEV